MTSEQAKAAADAMPQNVVAHRLGDFVFTYHGVDSSTGDPSLWIVISSADPVANPNPPLGENIAVGCLDGSVKTFLPHLFASALADQNALRRSVGLPPLPDPRTVTHDAPAVPP